MAVNASTTSPATLLTSLKAGVDNGEIASWFVDKDGDFWHKAAQVKDVAYFTPKALIGKLSFELRWAKDVVKTREAYAELHAHAVRLFIIHGTGVTSIDVTL